MIQICTGQIQATAVNYGQQQSSSPLLTGARSNHCRHQTLSAFLATQPVHLCYAAVTQTTSHHDHDHHHGHLRTAIKITNHRDQ